MIKLAKFNEEGINEFRRSINTSKPENFDFNLLTDYRLINNLECGNIELNESLKFKDRLEMAEYLLREIPNEVLEMYRFDVGFWSWLSALYIKQLAPSKYNREDNYIYTQGLTENRHAVATPVILLKDYGWKFARLLLTDSMSSMGDMVEQIVSKRYIMRSPSYVNLITELYLNEKTGKSKAGSASKINKNKLANGRRSKAGLGSIRRLTMEIQRLELNYKLDSMNFEEQKNILSKEYSKFY